VAAEEPLKTIAPATMTPTIVKQIVLSIPLDLLIDIDNFLSLSIRHT
jgi:hypothetical protein